jgi:NodT family efflux transporter outer membrane factor (OMF) lipoprotein
LYKSVTSVAAATLLASCAVGPDFKAPAAPDVSGYAKDAMAIRTASTDAPTGQSQRLVVGHDLPKDWWTLFRSKGLNKLIERSLANNPSLQSAIASLRAANQAVYAQEGHFFPLVTANFSPTRQLTAGPISPVLNSGQNPFNLYTAQVAVSYTFDIWGLNRRTVEQLKALADNQRFQVEAAYLTLASSVALAAINEASLRDQIAAIKEEISINTKMLGILKRQLETGYANRNDVALQEAALAQVVATLPPLQKALQQQRNAMAALVGAYPSDEPRETFHLANLHLPNELPVSLPAKLIEQRPDVRAAQEQLHAASASIGIATANILPTVSIGAGGGYTNTVLPGLISAPNLFWSLAGSATQSVFDGGTLLHDLQGAKDTYHAAAWSYQGTVLGAVQNVADSLRAVENDANALKAARDFERASKISFDLARQQMQTGYANILILLTAEQTYLQAVTQVVQARAARLSDTVALYQALGGGWWNRSEAPEEKTLDVSTGQTQEVADKSDNELRGIWPLNGD